MKRLIYIFPICLAFLICSCNDAKMEMFQGPESVYFRISAKDTTLMIKQDTIIYSFAFTPISVKERVIAIPVEMTGFASDHDRSYSVKVQNIGTTVSGVHYKPISSTQVFRKGFYVDTLYIAFNRTKDMESKSFRLGVTIEPSADFICGVKENLSVVVQVSDILEKPLWWDKWTAYFGSYHPLKYRKWMEVWGGIGDLSKAKADWWNSPKQITAIFDVRLYFEQNPTLDENGVLIVVPCPL